MENKGKFDFLIKYFYLAGCVAFGVFALNLWGLLSASLLWKDPYSGNIVKSVIAIDFWMSIIYLLTYTSFIMFMGFSFGFFRKLKTLEEGGLKSTGSISSIMFLFLFPWGFLESWHHIMIFFLFYLFVSMSLGVFYEFDNRLGKFIKKSIKSLKKFIKN